jgi:2'-5' RNA ligase
MRLFVGVELDEAVRAAAAETADRLRARLNRSGTDVSARWVHPANLHITLWFIGEVADERAAEVKAALQPRFATPAFEMSVRGLGAFPGSGPPRVFWLGIASGEQALGRLYGEVRDRLVRLGFEEEKRPYSAHLTIARVKEIVRGPAAAVRDALAALPGECGSSRVDAVTLFRSRLSPKGSQYEPLLRVPLS